MWKIPGGGIQSWRCKNKVWLEEQPFGFLTLDGLTLPVGRSRPRSQPRDARIRRLRWGMMGGTTIWNGSTWKRAKKSLFTPPHITNEVVIRFSFKHPWKVETNHRSLGLDPMRQRERMDDERMDSQWPLLAKKKNRERDKALDTTRIDSQEMDFANWNFGLVEWYHVKIIRWQWRERNEWSHSLLKVCMPMCAVPLLPTSNSILEDSTSIISFSFSIKQSLPRSASNHNIQLHALFELLHSTKML